MVLAADQASARWASADPHLRGGAIAGQCGGVPEGRHLQRRDPRIWSVDEEGGAQSPVELGLKHHHQGGSFLISSVFDLQASQRAARGASPP